MTRANLTEANLPNADLTGADLTKATLLAANLIGVNLTEAIVSKSLFVDTKVGWTVFANMDLSDARYLETVGHRGPSSVGIDTLARSWPHVPPTFLRGCGLSQVLLDYLPSLLTDPLGFYSCFISYSHADREFARKLHDTLQERAIRCWLDEKQLKPGDDIYHEVDCGLRLSDKVLLCCSENSLRNSVWVDREIAIALEKEQQLFKEHGEKTLAIVPLNLDGFLFSDEWASGYRRRFADGWRRTLRGGMRTRANSRRRWRRSSRP